jgi:GNAT superfamily N-acetyltransferase
MAGRLVRDPDELGAALAGLVSGGTVSWSPGDCPAGRDFEQGVMRLPDPAGGTLLVRRDEPPFTPAEFARAHALVDLAAAVLEQAGHRWQLLLPNGDELTVRLAGPEDADAVAALYAGRRACAGVARRRAAAARRPAAPGTLALVAETEPSGVRPLGVQPSGRVVAVAGMHREGTEAQVDLLVTEAYRRRGVGGALLRRVARLAAGSGVEALHAHACQPDGVALARAMGRLGCPVRQVVDGPMLTLTADLRPDATGPVPPATRPVEPGIPG